MLLTNSTRAAGLLSTALILMQTLPAADAAPMAASISSSVLQEGQIYSVNGSGFGAKESAAPRVWDDFDSDTPGEFVPANAHGTYWDVYAPSTGRAPRFSLLPAGIPQRRNNDVCVLQDFSENMNKNLGIRQPWVDKLYISMWLYRHDYEGHASWADNAKISGNWARLQGGSWVLPEIRFDCYPSNNTGHLFFTSYNQEHGAQDWTQALTHFNEWIHLERYVNFGTLNQPDGVSWMRINGQEVARVQGIINSEEGYSFDVFLFGHYFADHGDPCPTPVSNPPPAFTPPPNQCPEPVPMRQYVSQAYADTTLQRIMVCDQNSWSIATTRHCEVQIPRDIWTDGQIQFEARRGSFSPGQQLYLFVIDASDTASNSIDVSFSSQGDLLPPANPENLRLN